MGHFDNFFSGLSIQISWTIFLLSGVVCFSYNLREFLYTQYTGVCQINVLQIFSLTLWIACSLF